MKKIAIIGANEQQNPLILKAREMGLETHTFAWHSGFEQSEENSDFFYPISAGNKQEILEKCIDIGVDAITSICSDMAALSAAYVAEKMNLVGNPYEAVRRATNKILTRRLFEEKGISQPRFVEIGDRVPFDELKDLKYPLVIKPSDRSAARGIKIINDEGEFFHAINHARDYSIERKAIAEEYVSGRLYSCECLSVKGKHSVIGFTARSVDVINGRPFEYKYEAPAIISTSVEKRVASDAKIILDAMGLANGASSIEFIVDESNRVYYIEVSPNMYGDYIGTDLVPSVYGLDYCKAVVRAACGEDVTTRKKSTGNRACVEFEYSKTDGTRFGHKINVSPVKEFGGCLPLTVGSGTPFYSEDQFTMALNSEYTAFWCALKMMKAKRIHIPHYASSIWERIAEDLGVACLKYHIDCNFIPTDLSVDDGDAVMIVNYHGLCAGHIKDLAYPHLIIDNSTAFYEEPIMRAGVYNIYSCRKFFAVPDGAYLVSQSLDRDAIKLQRDISYKRAIALLHSLELGESAAYKDMQTNEQDIAKTMATMSVLTEKMLSAIDYDVDRQKRKANFDVLNKGLKFFNNIILDELFAPPQFYPLLVDRDIRARLLEKKIYIPLMWRRTLEAEFDGLAEKQLSENLVCLPISPEYSEEDMEYLAQTVIASIT